MSRRRLDRLARTRISVHVEIVHRRGGIGNNGGEQSEREETEAPSEERRRSCRRLDLASTARRYSSATLLSDVHAYNAHARMCERTFRWQGVKIARGRKNGSREMAPKGRSQNGGRGRKCVSPKVSSRLVKEIAEREDWNRGKMRSDRWSGSRRSKDRAIRWIFTSPRRTRRSHNELVSKVFLDVVFFFFFLFLRLIFGFPCIVQWQNSRRFGVTR